MNIVSVNNIFKKIGNVEILKDVSFQLEKGTHVSIVGPSGSGKTTLLRIIAGLEMPDSGKVYIEDKLVSDNKICVDPHLRKIGFVFQTASLWPHMTIEQNILFGLKGMEKKKAEERLNELLQSTAIEHLRGRYPDEISGGEARRVSIARSLAPKPICLLMDEPLTNLDTELKESLMTYILDQAKNTGTSLLYVTHDLYEAKYISGNILQFHEKRWCKAIE